MTVERKGRAMKSNKDRTRLGGAIEARTGRTAAGMAEAIGLLRDN